MQAQYCENYYAKSLNDVTCYPRLEGEHNVDVAIETSSDAIKTALIKQLYSPVRWTETVQFLASQGVTELVEVGAGKVLAGLTKRIEKSLSARSVNDLASLEAFLGE